MSVACSGKLYAVHKLVLSSCSDYFSTILRETNCPQPVIILKDITCEDFEALLSYMYLGEVNVLHEKLSSLLKASESLGIKGLAFSDDTDEIAPDTSTQILEENVSWDFDNGSNYLGTPIRKTDNVKPGNEKCNNFLSIDQDESYYHKSSSSTGKFRRKSPTEDDIQLLESVEVVTDSGPKEVTPWMPCKKLRMNSLAVGSVSDIFPNCTLEDDIGEFCKNGGLEDMVSLLIFRNNYMMFQKFNLVFHTA